MDDFTPPTEPSGDLVPPPRVPPTAVATLSPEPLPYRPSRQPYLRSNALWRLVDRTLDAVDGLADSVAEGLGFRQT
jgi:hypothetical protein